MAAMDNSGIVILSMDEGVLRRQFRICSLIAAAMLFIAIMLMLIGGSEFWTSLGNHEYDWIDSPRGICSFSGAMIGSLGVILSFALIGTRKMKNGRWVADGTGIQYEPAKGTPIRIQWNEVKKVYWRSRLMIIVSIGKKINLADRSGLKLWNYKHWCHFQQHVSKRLNPHFNLEIPVDQTVPQIHLCHNPLLDRVLMVLAVLLCFAIIFSLAVASAIFDSLWPLLGNLPLLIAGYKLLMSFDKGNWRFPIDDIDANMTVR